MTRILFPWAFWIVGCATTFGQIAPSTPPTFEVVSIRPCDAGGPRGGGGRGEGAGSGGGGAGLSPGRLHVSCNTLEGLIQEAYHIYANGTAFKGHVTHDSLNPVEGGPAWIKSERYDINAVAVGTPGMPVMRGPMMRALLEDRFKLKLRREMREVSVYVLTVAKNGLKLSPREEESCNLSPGKRPPNACGNVGDSAGTLDHYGISMSDFAQDLRNILNRPISDKTGIQGRFDFHLKYRPDEATRPENSASDIEVAPTFSPATDPAGYPSIFTAVQEQLGLKLDRGRGSDEFLVIDHVERPSEN